MPFTNPSFPGQIFSSIEEFDEARRKRTEIESSISERSDEITTVTATVIPASKDLLERKISALENKIQDLERKVTAEPTENKECLKIGTTLRGESRGEVYTLDVLD